MKKIKIIVSVSVIIAIICTGTSIVFAFADQENELEFCDHDYTILGFENGIATAYCFDCGSTEYLEFEDYINSEDCEELDMNSDGIVNARIMRY